jgi:hypothetical protein
MYDKSIANTIVNGAKLKPFPLKLRIRQGCPFSPHILNIVLRFLARAIRQEEKVKGTQIGMKEVKLSLFSDDTTSYLKDSKNSTKKLLHLINTFNKVAKSMHKKQ